LACSVCGQPGEPDEADFCPTHARALESVREAYEVSANAFGGISRADFLNRVGKLQGTGRNAREIAEFLHQHPETWK
jgi:hypothetical protein